MLRVDGSCLNKVDGKYYFSASLFTGIAYFHENDRIKSIEIYQDGIYVNPYDASHLGVGIIEYRVVHPALDMGDYQSGLAYLDDKLFTGVSFNIYENNCFCHAEEVFLDGESVLEYEYDEKGELIAHGENINDKLACSYRLNDNLTICNFNILDPTTQNRVYLDFDVNGALESIAINEIYYQDIEITHNWLDKAGLELDWPEKHNLASRLRVGGALMNAEFLDRLLKNKALMKVEKLCVRENSLGFEKLCQFIGATNLREVELNLELECSVSECIKMIRTVKPSVEKIYIGSDVY